MQNLLQILFEHKNVTKLHSLVLLRRIWIFLVVWKKIVLFPTYGGRTRNNFLV